MGIRNYKEYRDEIIEAMTTAYALNNDSIKAAYSYAENTYIIESDYKVRDEELYLYFISTLLFEVLHNDVEKQAEATGTFVIYKYDRDEVFKRKLLNSISDPEVLDEDIKKIKSLRELKYEGFEAAGI